MEDYCKSCEVIRFFCHYLDWTVTRNLTVTYRNHQIGIQNIVCPSVHSCDAWLVVDCPSQLRFLQLSLASITHSQQPWEKSAAAQLTLHISINNCPITTRLPSSFCCCYRGSTATVFSVSLFALFLFFLSNWLIPLAAALHRKSLISPSITLQSPRARHHPMPLVAADQRLCFFL